LWREYDAAMPRPGTPPPSPAAPRVYTARGQVEGEDWAGVAHALNERMAALRIGQQELAERSGVSVSTLRQLQHGASRRVQNRTLAAISTALDWPEDHLTAVLRSGHRTPRATTPGEPDPVLDGLHRIEAQLTDLADRLASIETLLRATGT
jgi:DNA-binding Xre family transcriptional regulator